VRVKVKVRVNPLTLTLSREGRENLSPSTRESFLLPSPLTLEFLPYLLSLDGRG